MALFGGLLCLSGESEGCTLLKCSQSDSGQFWRSPAHLGELPTPHHSPFSGDQFNGVAAFFLGNTDPSACPIPGSASLSNKERLESYIKFVSGNKTSYSSSQTYPDYGFKSCQETPGNETCLLQGKEWAWLKILSDKVGASPDPTIPSDLQDFESRYGFKWDFLEWMASSSAIGKYGFETHLVGVEIFLAQMAGISHPSIQRAAAILTARQPTNPFFLYLHLGRDQRVVDALRATCFVNPAPGAGGDWAWQRDLMYEEAWKSSMGWDCIFMLNLMLGGSGQNPNLAFSVPAETAYTDVNNGCAGQHKVVQECRIAEPGKVILQSTARLDLVEHRGAKPPAESCAMTFSDYVGVVPDVAFPSKVCVEARAQSFAGYDSNHCWVGVGNSGRAVCSFRAAQNPIQ